MSEQETIERWLIVGGYDGARHANFVRSGPQLTPNGNAVEVVPASQLEAVEKQRAYANECLEEAEQRAKEMEKRWQIGKKRIEELEEDLGAEEELYNGLAAETSAVEEKINSDECICGKDHRASGMAGTDYREDGLPKTEGCRALTWKEVAERNSQTAIDRRNEGKQADRELETAQEKIKRLEGELRTRRRVITEVKKAANDRARERDTHKARAEQAEQDLDEASACAIGLGGQLEQTEQALEEIIALTETVLAREQTPNFTNPPRRAPSIAIAEEIRDTVSMIVGSHQGALKVAEGEK
jgi:chromosome segregation ATPase